MKFIARRTFIALVFGALCGAVLAPASAADTEYAFKVRNKTKQKIVNILVSEDKKTWSRFEIGEGISVGKTNRLVWSVSTNDQECKQWVKAVFEDETETKPVKFDFCRGYLTIEFEE